MACTSCASGTNEDGTPKGCGSKGNCGTGSCNKRSSYDWLADLGIDDPYANNIVEVAFKAGASQDFFHAPAELEVFTGDEVAVETDNGFNVGRITLSGELVRLQMKKKKVPENKVTRSILRKANVRDIEKVTECRELERDNLVRARAIARQNHAKMKISDLEYQGDGRKCTIYYTAEDRVDFRELVRQFSHQFRVKIEMRQIGPRQETARLGGIGSCGRELCCSTWLSDFAAVNTAAARYQNIAINQQKLSGQCGRLKCCLNYELDTYMEALEVFPKKADKIKTAAGLAILIKTDIFKGIMYYTYRENRGLLYPIPVAKVHEFIALNRAGEEPSDLHSHQLIVEAKEEVFEYEDVTGAIDLQPLEKSKRRRKKPGDNQKGRSGNSRRKSSDSGSEPKTGEAKSKSADKPATDADKKEGTKSNSRRKSRSNTRNKKGGGDAGAKNTGNAKSSGDNAKPKPSPPKASGDAGQTGGTPRKKRTPRRKKTGGGPPKEE